MGRFSTLSEGEISLARAALRTLAAGGKLTQREERALKKYRKQQEEEIFWRLLNSVSKNDWKEWSGVPYKTLRAFRRFGFDWPLKKSGKLSVPEFLAWVFPFLAEHSRKLMPESNDDRPAIERLRLAQAHKVEFQNEQEEELWLKADLIHLGHARITGLLRGAGEALQRQFGAAARQILDDALDDCQREIQRLLNDGSKDDS